MATSNISVTPSWVKLADASVTELLVTWNSPVTIEFATTAADTAPVVNGHRVNNNSAITRTALGPGYVWAKLIPGSKPAEINVIVSK